MHGGVSHDGRTAHDQSGFQMFAAGNRLPAVNIQLLVGLRARTDPGLSSSFYLRSVVAYIANSGVEIFGHPLGASKIGSVVKARRRYGNCNFVEAHSLSIEFVAHVHFFLHRSTLDQNRFDGVSQRALPLLHDLFRSAAHAQALYPARCRKSSAQY